MRRLTVVPVVLLALLRCVATPDQPDHQSEWRDVLRHKKAAITGRATPQARQQYADALSAFVSRHPGHLRAREVYQRLQLEFANDLSALGRYRDAIPFYRAVLTNDPRDVEAHRGLSEAMDRLAVTHDKLARVEIGMSQRDVVQLLGRPIPGWTGKNVRRSARIEAWYYSTTSGAVAAVYFRDGEVFAAEETSQARTAL